MINCIICGSRGFNDYKTFKETLLEDYPLDYYTVAQDGTDVKIISGGAKGTDSMARELAYELMQTYANISFVEYLPDWDKHGKKAGIMRNVEMLESGQPHIVIAFWDGKSRGTKHMIDIARKAGVKVVIYST